MIANIGSEALDDAFRRVRNLDVSLREQLLTFAEEVRRERPEFAGSGLKPLQAAVVKSDGGERCS
jgi:hypothetical protein